MHGPQAGAPSHPREGPAAAGAAGTALFLVRFGEIGIKSQPVRRRFQQRLADNILASLRARGCQGGVEHLWGRLFVRAPEPEGREVLARTFGVVSFSPVREAPATLPELAAFCAAASDAHIPDGARFAVRAKRSGTHPFTSADIGREVGAAILAAHGGRGLRVDLTSPDVEVLVEVRDRRAWVGFERIAGPGGLPVGSEGRVVAWLASPRDAGAAWAMMRRGCRVRLVAPAGHGEARGLAQRLAAWDAGLALTEVPPGGLERPLVVATLDALAAREDAAGLVVGDGLAAALATARHDAAASRPVFRPLAAPDEALLEAIARHLGLPPERLEEVPSPPEAAATSPLPPDAAPLHAEAAKRLADASRIHLGITEEEAPR